MALTNAGANTALDNADVLALSGNYKFRADGFTGDETATFYEETNTADTYGLAKSGGAPIVLTAHQPTVIIEAYGNYKVVISDEDIEVGYAS